LSVVAAIDERDAGADPTRKGATVRFTDMGLGGRGELKSDINVTPLISVLLVVLINIMVSQPMISPGVSPKLPQAVHSVVKRRTDRQQTVVVIDANQSFYVNSVRVREQDIVAKVKDSLESTTDQTVLVIGDTDAPYRAVMALMDKLRAAEIRDVALVVEQRESQPGRAAAVR